LQSKFDLEEGSSMKIWAAGLMVCLTYSAQAISQEPTPPSAPAQPRILWEFNTGG